MKRFVLEKTNADIISHGGLSLIGQAIKNSTRLTIDVDTGVPLRHGISHSDVLKTYLGLLCLGKSDFESVNTIESENFFMTAMDVDDIPSEATLRQRMDERASDFITLVNKANIEFLINRSPELTPVFTGHIAVDADVTPFDNSRTKKEGVSRTYKGHDGYAPMAAYIGQEGYCLEFELREGKQHCQKGTPDFLKRVLHNALQITDKPLLLRLDSGNDAIENVDLVLDFNESQEKANLQEVSFIIKWNPRQEDRQKWLDTAELHGNWTQDREGKRTALFTVEINRPWKGNEYTLSRVMRVIERTIDSKGQHLLTPEIELEGWWTNLDGADQDIVRLYEDHGTSEQFHSEFKTDLDIERLPSGKFDTNALVLVMSSLAYNILRWIGQNGLLGPKSPKRHPAKRRRIKTVMQELMYVAVRVSRSARYIKLQFGKGCRVIDIFQDLYAQLSYG